jgi:acetyltransferase-like isoleucine patch superfamily enzyme
MNVLIEKETELTSEDKRLFAYFGEGAKIRPPFRILNPQNIHIGDRTTIREGAYIHAYCDLTELIQYIDEKYRGEFNSEDYKYDSKIVIGDECQIHRFMLMVCTNSITVEKNVAIGQGTFIGDNNHTFSHPFVPIMQQPNEKGKPIIIKKGTWIGLNSVILGGTTLGENTVVGAHSVVQGGYPSHAIIAPPRAKMILRRFDEDNLHTGEL